MDADDRIHITPDARRDDVRGTDQVRDDLRRDPDGNAGDEIGEAVGGISGVLTGAALGSLGGPIGTVIGGIAGAVSGWWAGRAISEAASHATDEDDSYYRGAYERAIDQRVGTEGVATGGRARSYDDVRPAYQLGHLAGRNPDYQGRTFSDVEGDLRHGWNDDVSRQYGAWDEVRPHVQTAYERSQSAYANAGQSAGNAITGGMSALGAGATYAAGRTGFGTGAAAAADRTADRTADRVEAGADRAWDATKDTARDAGNAVERAWDKTKAGAERLADRAADAVDDTKDRVDGNPASRPGPDATDRTDRRY